MKPGARATIDKAQHIPETPVSATSEIVQINTIPITKCRKIKEYHVLFVPMLRHLHNWILILMFAHTEKFNASYVI